MSKPKSDQTVLVVGSGGREHALVWKLLQSPRISKLYVAPGNGGISQLAEVVPIPVDDFPALAAFAQQHAVDLTVIGPDDPLADGIVNAFQAAGLRVFGPNRAAAEIEASKAYAKALMAKHHIPTAKFQIFTDHDEALTYARQQPLPLVIKASGLALGKGVSICHTTAAVEQALSDAMADKIFGNAGDEVVIEEFMTGPEISIHALSDGRSYLMFPSSQDHKPIHEGNKGPNTGGMGTLAPVPWVTEAQISTIEEEIVKPTLAALAADDRPFNGLLYPGLVVTAEGAKVIEFNARFGDPETQSYMRLLDSDLLDLVEACVDGKLDHAKPVWKSGFAVCIAVASGGYPGKYEKGLPISGLEAAAAQPDIVVFHAGTTFDGTTYRTAGGRVLGVSATGDTLQAALDKAYAAIKLIDFDDMYYRRDIGAATLAASS